MLPGTQSNLVAQQAHTAHLAAAHAVVQISSYMYRNAALLELADRYVGELSERLAQSLGIRSSVRRVLISAESQRHAIARRAISSKIDADLVAHRIAEAFSDVRYMRLPQQDPQVFALVGYAASADRWLLMPLKFVASLSPDKPDELWIRTAHPFGKKNLRKAKAKGLLHSIVAENAF